MRQHALPAPKISIFTSWKLKQSEGECEKGACGKDREMCDYEEPASEAKWVYF